uniref:Uncharacterized protein n=1 Tax=Oryza punctata TaxID=4537 RepID=A0A0E0M110_ORYPU
MEMLAARVWGDSGDRDEERGREEGVILRPASTWKHKRRITLMGIPKYNYNKRLKLRKEVD